MEIPTGILAKILAAMQRCKSERAALTNQPARRLASSLDRCYIRFARYEDKSYSLILESKLCIAALDSSHSGAAFENHRPFQAGFLETLICSY
jgi:hypothetical protein